MSRLIDVGGVTRDHEERREAEPRTAWLAGWRGRPFPGLVKRTPWLAGRRRRVLAQRLGLWVPGGSVPYPGRDARRIQDAYLREFGRAVRKGCDVDDVLRHFPIPPEIVPT